MAKNRMVSTSFWSDHYVADLDPTEKLLFLHLLTNERSTLAGIYELPVKMMAVETGIESEMIRKILGRFEEDGKVKFENGWVAIKNFLKHHEHGSPTVKKGIDEAIKAAPGWAREFVGKGIDTLTPSSSSLAFSSIGANTPEYDVVPEKDEEKTVSSRKPKYPNAKQVFALWGKYPKNWDLNSTQQKAAENLFEEQGLEDIKEALDFYEKHQEDEWCPKINSPYDLDAKWKKLEDHLDRIS